MSKVNTYRGGVLSWECDEIGHMNVMYYVNKFELAGHYLAGCFGLTHQILKERNWGTVAVKQEINYHEEAVSGALLYINSSITDIGNRSFTAHHEMRNATTNRLVSSAKIISVIFDLNNRKAIDIPNEARLKMEELLE